MTLAVHSLSVPAQKNDYMWALGVSPKVYPELKSPRFFFNFHTDPPSITLRTDSLPTGEYTASYSDDAGNILAFSNGFKIFNRYGELIENGYGINLTLHDYFDSIYYSYPDTQSGFFLADLNDPSILYFITLDLGKHPQPTFNYYYTGRRIVVSTIDLEANNGAGKVLRKDQAIIEGILNSAAAVRHANGRDWWIVASDADENRHYRVLLSPEGFSLPAVQEIGSKPNAVGKGTQSVGNCFSPSGRWYVDRNDLFGFSVFQFDRCSGLLFNERRVEYPPNTTNPNYYRNNPGTGVVFSPDDKLLYTTQSWQMTDFISPIGTKPWLLQYDLSADSLAGSVDTINYNNPYDYYPYDWGNSQVFLGAEMGPDGRIYIVHHRGSYCSVRYPNVRGKGCKFVYDQPFFGIDKNAAIPYMPNYRLGPLDGSPCDTLGIDNVPVAHFRTDDSLNHLSRYFYDLSYYEPAEWHWDFDDGTTSADTNALHTYDHPGIYQVCLTVKNANGSHTTCRKVEIKAFSSIGGEPAQGGYMQITPNPADQSAQVFLPPHAAPTTLLVRDMLGAVKSRQAVLPGQSETNLSLSQWPSGIYALTVVDACGKPLATARLVVAH
ncbi:MAG TPA: PKD domain-containing protein [Saprospiraceae bacterium]|nr:PKD domain-containing protein [Saprospiraceae bacterium]